MFHGSLPATAQQILCQIVKQWNVDDIYVGCSGNFTIERCLKHITPARLHSNDVTVYSCLIGRYFTGKKLNATLKPEYNGVMNFVEKYLDDGAGTMAVILILSKMGIYLGSKPNPYYERMIKAYINQFDTLWNRTKSKLEKIEPFITSMFEGDVCEWVDTIPDEAGFICYPPFFAGDYEKMFRVIDDMFDWNPPSFENINKDRINEMFEKLARRKYFMFGTNDYLADFKEYLVGMCQTTNRGVPLYIYAKSNKSMIVSPRQKTESLLIPRLGENEEIGNNIKIFELKQEEFQALRSQYMNIHINPGQATAAFGVTVDNKLIGVYAFSAAPTTTDMSKYIDTPSIYLLSDFPIAPVKYKRLSKLVLYAALSKESKEIAEKICNKRIYSLTTTAFSKKPVSMKYRGLFHLLNKKQLEGTDDSETDMSKIYYGNGYMLNYGAELGQWTLAEGLDIWKSKYGKECIK